MRILKLWQFLILSGGFCCCLVPGCGPEKPEPAPPPKPHVSPVESETSAPITTPQVIGETLPAAELIQFSLEPPQAFYHEVKEGDSLSLIGKKYEVTVEQLLAGNGLDRESFLQPGQLVYIPGHNPAEEK